METKAGGLFGCRTLRTSSEADDPTTGVLLQNPLPRIESASIWMGHINQNDIGLREEHGFDRVGSPNRLIGNGDTE